MVEKDFYRDVIKIACRRTKTRMDITFQDLMECEVPPPPLGTISFQLWLIKHYLGPCYLVRKDK